MVVEGFTFEIKIVDTGRKIPLELTFVVDGKNMTVDKMLARIKERLDDAAEGKKYTINYMLRETHDLNEQILN